MKIPAPTDILTWLLCWSNKNILNQKHGSSMCDLDLKRKEMDLTLKTKDGQRQTQKLLQNPKCIFNHVT